MISVSKSKIQNPKVYFGNNFYLAWNRGLSKTQLSCILIVSLWQGRLLPGPERQQKRKNSKTLIVELEGESDLEVNRLLDARLFDNRLIS